MQLSTSLNLDAFSRFSCVLYLYSLRYCGFLYLCYNKNICCYICSVHSQASKGLIISTTSKSYELCFGAKFVTRTRTGLRKVVVHLCTLNYIHGLIHQWWWGLNSNSCPGRRGFEFMIFLNAFTTVDGTDTGEPMSALKGHYVPYTEIITWETVPSIAMLTCLLFPETHMKTNTL